MFQACCTENPSKVTNLYNTYHQFFSFATKHVYRNEPEHIRVKNPNQMENFSGNITGSTITTEQSSSIL